mmetsp:Transcript_31578/g.90579  ORF Transcript_31578/g.90579 Transcript_31578/m.90579 type:complete len:101 (+) Transcript_31578:608-910(+)
MPVSAQGRPERPLRPPELYPALRRLEPAAQAASLEPAQAEAPRAAALAGAAPLGVEVPHAAPWSRTAQEAEVQGAEAFWAAGVQRALGLWPPAAPPWRKC